MYIEFRSWSESNRRIWLSPPKSTLGSTSSSGAHCCRPSTRGSFIPKLTRSAKPQVLKRLNIDLTRASTLNPVLVKSRAAAPAATQLRPVEVAMAQTVTPIPTSLLAETALVAPVLGVSRKEATDKAFALLRKGFCGSSAKVGSSAWKPRFCALACVRLKIAIRQRDDHSPNRNQCTPLRLRNQT
jgi:hypothetical protein